MATTTAQVEVLTAEVRVLMVGSRQVTLSVYRQLDCVKPDDIEPFGRINDSQDRGSYGQIFAVGRHVNTGSLVRSKLGKPWLRPSYDIGGIVGEWWAWCDDQHTPHDGDYKTDTLTYCLLSDGDWSINFAAPRMFRRECDEHGRKEWHTSPDGDLPHLGPDHLEIVTDVLRDDARLLLDAFREWTEQYDEWEELPLIVLAGLR